MLQRPFHFLVLALLFFSILPAIYSAENPGPESQKSISEAVSSYYQGDFEQALERLLYYTEQIPNDNKARLNLIQLLREAGRFDDALAEIGQLLESNPGTPEYQLSFLRTAYLAGRMDLVISEVTPAEVQPEKLFWLGLALSARGEDGAAVKVMEKSLALQPFNPSAHYMLGRIHFQNNRYEKAQDCFLRTLTQEPNFSMANLPLALSYIALEKYQKAYNLLLSAAAISPWNKDLSGILQKLTRDHPELVQQKQERIEKNRQIAIPPQAKPIMEHRQKIPEIRIGLAEKVKQLYLKTGAAFTLTNPEGIKSFTGNSGAVLKIDMENEAIAVYSAAGALLFSSNRKIILSYPNPGATTILFDVEYGGGSFWAGRADRIYRGTMELLPRKEGITVINRVNVEEYLYSVVASEMSPSWPAAALEVQAIAARTYTFANLGQYESRGFDLWATVVSQVYNGVSAETNSTRTAVDATRGKILTYNGKPIAAFFTANSGGYTKNSQDVWNFSLPYLQAVPDPLSHLNSSFPSPEELALWLNNRSETYSSNPKYSARSAYRWTLWVPRLEIENRLNLGDKLGNIVAVTTVGRGAGGVVKQVLIKGTSGEHLVKSDAIRSKLGGLRSNLFIVEPKLGADGRPEYFVFTGAGWGHGVGMCQSGAAGMAAAGYSYESILQHFYPGTKLENKYEIR